MFWLIAVQYVGFGILEVKCAGVGINFSGSYSDILMHIYGFQVYTCFIFYFSLAEFH